MYTPLDTVYILFEIFFENFKMRELFEVAELGGTLCIQSSGQWFPLTHTKQHLNFVYILIFTKFWKSNWGIKILNWSLLNILQI
jgi:hypothetical protein